MTDRTTTVWKLGIVTALASLYLIAWRAIAGSITDPSVAETAEPEADTAAPLTDATTPATAAPIGARTAVWIDQLPPAQRPVVALPPGWKLAARDRRAAVAAIAPAPTPPRRVPATAQRRLRVRTRSS